MNIPCGVIGHDYVQMAKALIVEPGIPTPKRHHCSVWLEDASEREIVVNCLL